jgi:hypothetical protein
MAHSGSADVEAEKAGDDKVDGSPPVANNAPRTDSIIVSAPDASKPDAGAVEKVGEKERKDAKSPVIFGCFDGNGKCNLIAWRKALAKLKGRTMQELQVKIADACQILRCFAVCVVLCS